MKIPVSTSVPTITASAAVFVGFAAGAVSQSYPVVAVVLAVLGVVATAIMAELIPGDVGSTAAAETVSKTIAGLPAPSCAFAEDDKSTDGQRLAIR